jgi:hypothetical protein
MILRVSCTEGRFPVAGELCPASHGAGTPQSNRASTQPRNVEDGITPTINDLRPLQKSIGPRDPRAPGVALDSVALTDITPDPFEAEVRIVNTGLVPIGLPVSAQLRDLQPADEWQTFQHFSLALEVKLSAMEASAGLRPRLR